MSRSALGKRLTAADKSSRPTSILEPQQFASYTIRRTNSRRSAEATGRRCSNMIPHLILLTKERRGCDGRDRDPVKRRAVISLRSIEHHAAASSHAGET